MDSIDTTSEFFAAHIEDISATAVSVPELLGEVSEVMVHALLSDHKVLCAGSGYQSAIAQIFASHLVSHPTRERPGLPAIALSADSCLLNSLGENGRYADGVARQVSTWGNPGDILLLIAGARTEPLTRAISAAHERDLTVVLLHGGAHTDAAALLSVQDIEIAVPVSQPSRLLQTNLVLINCLCELVDMYLFGAND